MRNKWSLIVIIRMFSSDYPGIMTDDYVARRKEYVNEIRRSFNHPEEESLSDEAETHSSSEWVFMKIRMVIAIALMIAFFILKYNDYDIYGYRAKDILDIISNNQYYTILQDYVMME